MVGIKRPLSHRQNSEQPNNFVLKNCWSVKLLNLFSCFQGLQRLHHYRNMLFKASSSPVPLETLHLWRGHGNSNIIPLSHLLTQFYLFCPSSFSTPFQAMSKTNFWSSWILIYPVNFLLILFHYRKAVLPLRHFKIPTGVLKLSSFPHVQ